jgi:hypothetical protein
MLGMSDLLSLPYSQIVASSVPRASVYIRLSWIARKVFKVLAQPVNCALS